MTNYKKSKNNRLLAVYSMANKSEKTIMELKSKLIKFKCKIFNLTNDL